jgi:hypothetical protein
MEHYFDAPTLTCLEIHLMQGTKYQHFSTVSIKIDSTENDFLSLSRARMHLHITTNSSKNQLDRQKKRNSDIVHTRKRSAQNELKNIAT